MGHTKKLEDDKPNIINQYFNISPDPILLVDLVSGDILGANKAFDHLYGSCISNLKEQNVFKLDLFKSGGQRSNFYKALADHRSANDFDFELKTHSGEYINVSLSGSLVNFEGREVIIGSLRDVSSRVQKLKKIELEKETLQYHEAEEKFHRALFEEHAGENVALLDQVEIYKNELVNLNNQKDRFFSIIAHDLKSPFTAILGFSSMLKDNVKFIEKEQVVKFADHIHSSATNAYDILNDLLDWAMAQMGKLSYEPRSYALVEGIKKIQYVFTPLAQAKEIELIWDVENNLETISDQKMVETILRNLIANSIKFTNPKGSITTKARQIDGGIEVSVSDDGVGMTKEQVNNIFSILNKSSTQGTAGELGTGLGLTLCQEFVALHSGKISVDSEKGKGTCFTFTIPDQKI